MAKYSVEHKAEYLLFFHSNFKILQNFRHFFLTLGECGIHSYQFDNIQSTSSPHLNFLLYSGLANFPPHSNCGSSVSWNYYERNWIFAPIQRTTEKTEKNQICFRAKPNKKVCLQQPATFCLSSSDVDNKNSVEGSWFLERYLIWVTFTCCVHQIVLNKTIWTICHHILD